MKAIKLLGLFVGILVIVIIVLKFVNFGGSDTVDGTTLPPDQYDFYLKKIEKKWKSENCWNYEVFESNHKLVANLTSEGVVQNQVTSLVNHNCILGCDFLSKEVIAEWDKPQCSPQVIKNYIADLDAMQKENPDFSQDTNVKEIRSIHAIYSKAINFASKHIGCNAKLNEDGTEWNSFASYASNIRRQRSEIVNSSIYQTYLKNIESIKTALGDTENRLRSAKERFYTQLAQEIIGHYEEAYPSELFTKENYQTLADARDALNDACTRYNKESGAKNTALENFRQRFANEVRNLRD